MAADIGRLEREIRNYSGPPLKLMEVCGTHTRQIHKFGIPELLPPNITLVSGPGCPVCVTPAGYIDMAARLASAPGHTLLSFGDMMAVPGRAASLLKAKAAGGRVELMYSPMEALARARQAPDETIVVAAVGFETTLPIYALLIQRAISDNIKNVRLLLAVKSIPPALRWICENNPAIGGFIGPGHVSAIIGWGVYRRICERYRMPLAVAGFSYEHLIAAIADLIRQNVNKTYEAHNLYLGAVTEAGNEQAQALISRYFVRAPARWRGLGVIEDSGYILSPEYKCFDAMQETGGYAATGGPEPDGKQRKNPNSLGSCHCEPHFKGEAIQKALKILDCRVGHDGNQPCPPRNDETRIFITQFDGRMCGDYSAADGPEPDGRMCGDYSAAGGPEPDGRMCGGYAAADGREQEKRIWGDYAVADEQEPEGCLCGAVISGRASPADCALFGGACTPERPVGPCMVSGEGACGIWLADGRRALP